MRPDEAGDDFETAINISTPYSGYFQSSIHTGTSDDDAFILTRTGDSMTVTVLSDYLLLEFGQGVPPMLWAESILGGFNVYETYTTSGDPTVRSRLVTTAVQKEDTILQSLYPDATHAGLTFFDATFATPGARSVTEGSITYNYSGTYYVVVSGANSLDDSTSQELRDLIGDHFSAGRYLVTQGNPTGQRASTWGEGWIQHVDINYNNEAETNPTLLDAVATKEETTTADTAIVSVSGLVYDEPTRTWSGENELGQLEAIEGLTDSTRDEAGDIGRMAGSTMLDTALIAIQAFADAPKLSALAGVIGQLNSAKGVGQALHKGFDGMTSSLTRMIDNAGNADLADQYADDAFNSADQMILEASDSTGGPTWSVLRFFVDRMSVQTNHSILTVSSQFSLAGGQQVVFAAGHKDVFIGTAFGDLASLGDLNDAAYGGDGDDSLKGEDGSDALLGGDGNDTLDGGLGADALYGGAGNDLYYINDQNDRVVEEANEGVDTIRTSVSHSLTDKINVENLTIIGSGARNGQGNSRDNVVTGNAANNSLTGLEGADTLLGGGGDDTLDGGVGADRMEGGVGNDIYYVNHASDVVVEKVNSGVDVVRSSITYEIGAHIENLTIVGTGARNGTGNILDNALTGNAAANKLRGAQGNDTIAAGAGDDTLDGGVGVDFLRGEAGNDTYEVDNASDFVRELAGGGVDTVRTSVTRALDPNAENLVITGGAARNGSGNSQDNQITGNGAANILAGRLGNDTIVGGAGNDKVSGGEGLDVLTGGTGQDAFVFDSATGATNVDTITDFNVADDTILLDNAVFTALGAEGALNAGMFRVGSAPADANDFLYYNAGTGALYYDANGNVAGGAVRIATLTPGLALTAADFLVI